MTITQKDHQRITDRIQAFLTELEELGASSVICSFSCCISGVGWVATHCNAGDPMAGRGLAEDYLEYGNGGDGDDDVFFGFGEPPDEDEKQEWPVEG